MLHELDLRLFHDLYGPGRSGVLTTMIVLTLIGSGWSMLALFPLYCIRRTRGFAVSTTALLLVTSAVVFLLKRAVHRLRPCVSIEGVRSLWGAPTDYSFPSGHTTGSFAFAAFVLTLATYSTRIQRQSRMVASVVLLMLAFGVALSRVYLGVHFPSDVIGSAILGSVLGVVGGRVCRSRWSGANVVNPCDERTVTGDDAPRASISRIG